MKQSNVFDVSKPVFYLFSGSSIFVAMMIMAYFNGEDILTLYTIQKSLISVILAELILFIVVKIFVTIVKR